MVKGKLKSVFDVAHQLPSRSPSGLRERGKQKLLGSPEHLGSRILKAVIILSAMGAAAAIWTILIKDIDPQRSSFGAAAPVVQFATSTWSYIILELLLLRSIILVGKSRKAKQAASYLGMEPGAIRRFEAEAKSTSDSTRVVCTSEDSVREIRERLSAGFFSGEDDVLTPEETSEQTRVAAAEQHQEERGERLGALYEKEERLLERAEELEAGIEENLGDALTAPTDVERALLENPEKEEFSIYDLMEADAQEAVDETDTMQEELERVLDELQAVAEDIAALEARAGEELPELPAGDGAELLPTPADKREEDLPWRARYKLWRMDTAAALESGDLLWQFVAPAALSTFFLVLAAGIWLRPWMYPLLGSIGALVGGLNYYRISRSREKQVRTLRADDGTEQWDSCSVLIKGPIQAGSTEMSYAWFNGEGYAHHSPEELTEELAPRVHQLLNGEEISPSVLQKYYRLCRDMYPDLEGWRANIEEHRISTELISGIESAPNGIIPKAKLIEDTVEHDIEPRLFGLYEGGMGYDPELVRECYQELYPFAIVEEEMIVQSANGEEHQVTACRLRTEPLPADLSEVRAQFSSRFRAYAQFEPLYELPEVDREAVLQEHQTGGLA